MNLPDSLLAQALETIPDASLITDARQRIVYANQAFVKITGYTAAEVMGRNCRFLQSDETDANIVAEMRSALELGATFQGDVLNLRKDGSEFWNSITVSPIRDLAGEITHFVSVQRDISHEVNLRFANRHDAVTGLPNLMALSEHLSGRLRESALSGNPVVLGILDVDDFAQIAQTYGAIVTASVLNEIARRLKTELEPGDFVAQIGEDVFAFVVAQRAVRLTPTDIELIIGTVKRSLDIPFVLAEGLSTQIGTTVAVSLYPRDGTDELALFRTVEAALGRAKAAKTARVKWWNLSKKLPTGQLLTMSDLLPAYRKRFSDGGLVMYLQPIVSLQTGEVTIVESLARLKMLDGSIIPAAQFVPMLDSEELEQLFKFGIEAALSNLVRWDAAGLSLDISVNLDPLTLLSAQCAGWVMDALERHHIEPHRLILELLETRAVETEEQRTAIHELRELGVRLAIDDLGSGHSNLERLSHLDFDLIKVDAGILGGFIERPLQTLSIIFALTQLSENLERDAVVEGLENEDMVGVAAVLGATLAQGYYFGYPMPAESVASWIAAFTPPDDFHELTTFAAALAYHWRYGRHREHPGTLAECSITRFLATHSDGSEIDSWHAAQHTPEFGETCDRMMQWLSSRAVAH